MKRNLFITILFYATSTFGQGQSNDTLAVLQENILKQEISVLRQELNTHQTVINQHKNTLDTLSTKVGNQEQLIGSLKLETKNNAQNIQTIEDNLGAKIEQTKISTKDSISKLDENVSKNRLYWIIGTLATLLLGGIVCWLLEKRIKNNKTDVENQIKNTKTALEEESIKLDNKLVEVLETQLKLKLAEKQIVSANTNKEIDHSLALKVADEIVRIQKNISKMDNDTKGLKQLSASVKRIQDNFASNGYELVEMLGKEYNEGMKVIANFIPSEDIEQGKQVITRIIKPQVNFKNEMIQSAQIEVSVGE